MVDGRRRDSHHSGMRVRVSTKGRMTIPKAVRAQLGIRPGQVLDVRAEEGRLIVSKMGVEDHVHRVFGILKGRGSTDRFIEDLRGRPDAIDPTTP